MRCSLYLAPLLAASASAQVQVKPYILLAFDTSGSMLDDTCGEDTVDHSLECGGTDVACSTCGSAGCGDGIANDSRLNKVKLGASQVVNAFGEVVFALERFHQNTDNFSCKRGGWRGAPLPLGASWLCDLFDGCDCDPPGSGWNRGDVLVGFYEGNAGEILEWMDLCDDYPSNGVCPASTCPGGCGNCDGGGGRPPPICTGPGASCGNGCDKELRGHGFTPNSGLLRTSYTYFTSTIRPADPEALCRPYRVILLSDGAETCGGDPPAEAASLWGVGIPVHAVGFGEEPDLVTELNAIASAGGTGSAIFVDNADDLALEMAEIVASSILVEQCNGVDDDCDELIDETFPEAGAPCDNGQVGACARTGTYVCTADGTSTSCTAGSVAPGVESCNGQDDDCDGEVDEGMAGCVCYAEVCNGLDDDCDGLADEGNPGAGGPCGTDAGECTTGVWQCLGAAGLVCVGGFQPVDEECNCRDDDCNGIVDQVTRACYPWAAGCDPEAGTCTGTCAFGHEVCVCLDFADPDSWIWGGCEDARGPTDELCNGLDDDCDGAEDDDATCPNGGPCVEGSCALPCDVGQEFSCPIGNFCADGDGDGDGFCEEDPCAGVACAPGETCVAGVCTSVCEFVSCQGWQACDGARAGCVETLSAAACCADASCTNPEVGCGAGLCCDAAAHACVDCACDEIACDAGTVCREPGECVGYCAEPCAEGEACRDGACAADPCADVRCGVGRACMDGECILDPCLGVTCPTGQVCAEGACAADPCLSLHCPAGTLCGCTSAGVCTLDDYACHAPPRPPALPTAEVFATGAGGCGCSLGRRP